MKMCLSLGERDRRFAAVRSRMSQMGLRALLFAPNTGDWDNFQPGLRYLTSVGGGGTAAAGVFLADAAPVVAVREGRRVPWWKEAQDWVSDVRFPVDMRWSRFFLDVLEEHGIDSGRIGVAGLGAVLREHEGTVAHGTMLVLAAALPGVKFESAEDLMHDVRKRKSGEEIQALEASQILSDAVRTSLRNHARPGVSEGTVYAGLHQSYLSGGGEMPTMFLFAAEPRMWQTHLLPNSKRLLCKEDVLIIEADTKYLGYTAQAVDTVSLRPFTSIERRLFDISTECFHLILQAMRPGCPYSELVRLWDKTARSAGLKAGRTMGHGLGLGQDGPVTRPAGDAGALIVEAGDCFVLKPWISNADDSISARVGGLVIVEEKATRRAGKMELGPYVVQ